FLVIRYVVSRLSTSIIIFGYLYDSHRVLHSFPTRRSSDLPVSITGRLFFYGSGVVEIVQGKTRSALCLAIALCLQIHRARRPGRSEEHTSELQSRENLVCRLLLEKKNFIFLYIYSC